MEVTCELSLGQFTRFQYAEEWEIQKLFGAEESRESRDLRVNCKQGSSVPRAELCGRMCWVEAAGAGGGLVLRARADVLTRVPRSVHELLVHFVLMALQL